MPVSIRVATISDLGQMVDFLVRDAERRQAHDQALWKLQADAGDTIGATLKAAFENDRPPFRQQWLIAELDGRAVGITHSILLPVPPIYAGELGAPGLIMEDCFVADTAPKGTEKALLQAAEADLIDAGAKVLLASSVVGGAWAGEYVGQGYKPLTLYLAKTGLDIASTDAVAAASEDDVPAIVKSSAENRQNLFGLDPFWKPHPDADSRFESWMKRSLTLTDRDMFVRRAGGAFTGYIISQPATPLHFPAGHAIDRIGVIDDYFHTDFARPSEAAKDSQGACELLQVGEAALAKRGNEAALIVCPAAWMSKITVLEKAGYQTAIIWWIKTVH